jgi:hypothetical protein
MRKHFSDVKTLTGRDQTEKERRLNMMMFSVVTMFIISYSFDNTYFVLYNHFGITLPKNTTRILISISAVLLTLNSSVNIFFYSYFNENFRKNLGKVLSCKKSNQNINLVVMKTKSTFDTITNSK